MHPDNKITEDRPVPQGMCASLKPDMVYVQRGSCPAEALTLASEISSQADAPISFGSLDIPGDIANMEVEQEGVDMDQDVLPPSAQSFAIATPPTQADSTHGNQEAQQTVQMDLEDENDIQTDQVEMELPEGPLMLFQQLDSPDVKPATADAPPAPQSPSLDLKPATAEVHPAYLHEAEFTKVHAYPQEHVPHWTT